MQDRAQSISLKDLSQAVEQAVTKSGQMHAAFREAKPKGFVLHPWIIGFILREQIQLDRATIRDMEGFATDVASQLASVGGIGATGRPAAMILDKDIICGFFPQNAINALQM